MPKVKPLELRCPRCDSGPGKRCTNHKGRPCKPHPERRHVHVPKVDKPESYAESVAIRNENRKVWLLRFMDAVSHCGPGATAYALVTHHDRSGARPDFLVYVCRRPNWGGWRMKDGREIEEVYPWLNDRLGPPFEAYYSNKPGGDDSPGGFGFRWEVRYSVIDVPDVTPAHELQAAAQKRRDKALAKQAEEAERLAEWKRRNATPSLFDVA